MSEQKRIQHMGDDDRPGHGLCGATLNPDMAGLVVDCPECWQIKRGGSLVSGSHPRLV